MTLEEAEPGVRVQFSMWWPTKPPRPGTITTRDRNKGLVVVKLDDGARVTTGPHRLMKDSGEKL